MAESKDEKMSSDAKAEEDMDEADLKIILLGDSAVGKSKLVERYLMDNYVPRQVSRHVAKMSLC